MSQFYEYLWQVSNLDEIAKSQSITANQPLILNGSYINPITGVANLFARGVIPTVSFSSNEDVSNVNFTIIGEQNGELITEEINGPAAGETVSTTNCFDLVRQIIPDSSDNNTISVGLGFTGYLPLILVNNEKANASSLSYTINVVTDPDNPAFYTIYGSLKYPLAKQKFNELTGKLNMDFFEMDSRDESWWFDYSYTVKCVLVHIGGNDNNTAVKVQFLQT